MSTGYRFGRFELRPATRQLLAGGEDVPTGSRAFDVLRILIERRDRLVTKDELLDLAWPGLIVEENNIHVQISALRRILGPRAIATIPGRGYRFSAALDEAETAAPAPPPPTPLPDAAPLFGREADLCAVRALLLQHRLVTILGAGGMGKTRLAAAVAQNTSSTWIELASIAEPRHILGAIAAAVGAPDDNPRDPMESLCEALARKRGLLALDNGEHLIEALARVVEAILRRSPEVRVLVTSRTRLGLQDEVAYRLHGLDIPATGCDVDTAARAGAVALFAARARAADRRFELGTHNIAAAIEVCRRLDGMPLAIEFAAARIALLGLAKLTQQLDQRLKFLAATSRTAPDRQKTLRATLDWSFELLDSDQKALFSRLGVFCGGFTLEAAAAIAHDHMDEWKAADVLARLIDDSMVVADAADPPRYSLLETLRIYALEKLQGSLAMQQTCTTHAEYFATHFEALYARWLQRQDAAWAAEIRSEIPNARAALAHALSGGCEPELAVRLASATLSLWYIVNKRDRAELREHVATALRLLPEAAPGVHAGRLWVARAFLHGTAEPAAAREAFARAVEMFAANTSDHIHALVELARACTWCGDFERADATLCEAERQSAGTPLPTLNGLVHTVKAYIATGRGQHELAAEQLAKAIVSFQQAGASSLALEAESDIGDNVWACGDLDGAERSFRETVRRIRGTPLEHGMVLGLPLMNLAGVLVERGRLDEALEAAREALPMYMDLGKPWVAYDTLALRLARLGRVADAARLHGAGLAGYAAARLRLETNEARMRSRLQEMLAAAMSPEELQRLVADGGSLTAHEAAQLALS